MVIDASDVGEEVEPELRMLLQEPAEIDDQLRRRGEGVDAVPESQILDRLAEALRDQREIGRLRHGQPAARAAARSSGVPASARDLLIFSCKSRKPCIRASGRGGQPGTCTSTGTKVSEPCTTA